MKILYIANIRLPTEKAHGVQIMKMCEAFANAGIEIELLVPDRRTSIVEDAFDYYGIQTTFPITRLPVFDTIGWGRFGFLLESVFFGLRARRHVRTHHHRIVYGRDELVLSLMPKCRLIWETHTGAWNTAARNVAAKADHIIAISKGLKDFYVARGIPASKILVLHDGVDLEQFAHHETKDQARARLRLPLDLKVALYIGRLDGWKGSDTLLKTAGLLSEGVRVVIIGGEPSQVARLRREYPNVMFLGYRPYRELADNLAAADVLVLPNTGRDEISARFTSPLKLFSYMASNVPIVASDLPSVREVLDEKSAVFTPPDDPQALSRGILTALKPEGRELAERSRVIAERYTWSARAQSIRSLLSRI